MKTSNSALQSITKSPFIWGLLGSVGFFGLIHTLPPDLPGMNLVRRYFTGHPVEYMETVLFSIGLAALLVKLLDIFAQRVSLSKSLLGPSQRPGQPLENCDALLARLDRLSNREQRHYLASRLRAALEHVHHHGSADSLDDELKYLADLDIAKAQSDYGLFRVIVWAIPILGFLGTVIGITMALNAVDLQSPDQSMLKVLNGLGLKFDTTALALSLSMVLMFIHFYIESAENALLNQVDQRTTEELAGRFPTIPAGADGQVIAVRRMAETMLQAVETLVQRQAELWHKSMEVAASHWAQMANSAGERLQTSLSSALHESLKTFAQQFAAIEQAYADQARRPWDEMRQQQAQNIQLLSGVQSEVVRQAEVLQRAIEACGEVTRLEDCLNNNLAALAGAKHFEQTVLSLAAALNLLGARLAETPCNSPIKLEPQRRTSQAA